MEAGGSIRQVKKLERISSLDGGQKSIEEREYMPSCSHRQVTEGNSLSAVTRSHKLLLLSIQFPLLSSAISLKTKHHV